MPYMNGTGPSGRGPGTGRGRGWCRTGEEFTGMQRIAPYRRYGWFTGMVVSLVTVVIRDLLNPTGKIRQLLHKGYTVEKYDK